jgi:hypothetical protein
MKLSNETIKILKNFSSVKEMIFVKAGNTIKTESVSQTVRAEAVVEESFPSDFGIYDLSKFLGKLSMHNTASANGGGLPNVEFSDDKVVISDSDGKRKNSMKLCPVEFIGYPEEMGDIDIHHQFSLKGQDIIWMSKSSSISGSPHYIFECEGDGKVYMTARDVKDSSSDVCSIIVDSDESYNKRFRMVFSVQNFLLMPDRVYTVQLNTEGIGIFTSVDGKLKYYIGAEAEA